MLLPWKLGMKTGPMKTGPTMRTWRLTKNGRLNSNSIHPVCVHSFLLNILHTSHITADGWRALDSQSNHYCATAAAAVYSSRPGFQAAGRVANTGTETPTTRSET